jgi:hypothetical protein
MTCGRGFTMPTSATWRITWRPGPWPSWLKPYVERGFAAIQQSLEAAGRLALSHKGDAFQALPTTEPGMWYEVWVFDVLSRGAK